MKIFKLLIAIILPLVVGAFAGMITAQSVSGWYLGLSKPSFNPPDWIFGPVWTVLYILMGISLYMIWIQPKSEQRDRAILVFYIQLFFNFAWSFLFFYFKMIPVAFIEIMLLWLIILAMIFFFFRISKSAALLQIPYLVWVTFAFVLNGAIVFLNR